MFRETSKNMDVPSANIDRYWSCKNVRTRGNINKRETRKEKS